MKEFFGWVQDSDMASFYVHLSGRDVDRPILNLYGIEMEKDREENEVLRRVGEVKILLCPNDAITLE